MDSSKSDPVTTPVSTAEAVRIKYRARRAKQFLDTPLVSIAAPVVEGIIDHSDGTLGAGQVSPLKFSVEAWANAPIYEDETNVIEFMWGSARNSPVQYDIVAKQTVTLDTEFPLKWEFDTGFMATWGDGPYSLIYNVILESGDETLSDPTVVIIDTTPPYFYNNPTAFDLPTAQVSDDYLLAHDNKVVVELPEYGDAQFSDPGNPLVMGDKVAFYWESSLAAKADLKSLVPVDTVSVTSQKMLLEIPASKITEVGDGHVYVFYTLQDKVGNDSRVSEYATVEVVLGLLPTNFQPPIVELAEDGLLDLADALLGVVVEIPAFDNPKSTDWIEVTWGGVVLGKELLGSHPAPYIIAVPAQVLKEAYGDAPAGGVVDTKVSYRVLRGNVAFDPQEIRINVDFSVIGPINPAPWPDPVNTALLAPSVLGRAAGSVANTITDVDKGAPVDLSFIFYDPLVPGEIIKFYWGGVEVVEAMYTVTGTDVAGEAKAVEIPWSYVQGGNNGEVQVSYRISFGSDSNQQYSVSQLVSVSFTVTPDAPTFLGISSTGWLNCNSLYVDPTNPTALEPAVRVQVPDLSAYLSAGDSVTLHWDPHFGRSGDAPIAGAELDQVIELNSLFPVTGFVWYVQPYDTHIAPTYNGTSAGARVRISYSYLSAGGAIVKSEVEEILIGMFTAGSACEIPPPAAKR